MNTLFDSNILQIIKELRFPYCTQSNEHTQNVKNLICKNQLCPYYLQIICSECAQFSEHHSHCAGEQDLKNFVLVKKFLQEILSKADSSDRYQYEQEESVVFSPQNHLEDIIQSNYNDDNSPNSSQSVMQSNSYQNKKSKINRQIEEMESIQKDFKILSYQCILIADQIENYKNELMAEQNIIQKKIHQILNSSCNFENFQRLVKDLDKYISFSEQGIQIKDSYFSKNSKYYKHKMENYINDLKALSTSAKNFAKNFVNNKDLYENVEILEFQKSKYEDSPRIKEIENSLVFQGCNSMACQIVFSKQTFKKGMHTLKFLVEEVQSHTMGQGLYAGIIYEDSLSDSCGGRNGPVQNCFYNYCDDFQKIKGETQLLDLQLYQQNNNGQSDEQQIQKNKILIIKCDIDNNFLQICNYNETVIYQTELQIQNNKGVRFCIAWIKCEAKVRILGLQKQVLC